MDATIDKTIRLRIQVAILNEVAKEYPGRTIENVVQNLEERIKTINEHERRENGLP